MLGQANNQNSGAVPGAALFSPGGFVMLFIAATFDLLLIFCAILIAVFGIGIALGKIVNAAAFSVIGVWELFRSGTISTKKDKRGIGQKLAKRFFKKHWKKLAFSLAHIPTYTWTVYSELKNS